METRNFGNDFFGRNPFKSDKRKEFFEKWTKFTLDEKIEFMSKRIEDMDKDEHVGFFGGKGFGGGLKDYFREKWSKMSRKEKENFIKEREKAMKSGDFLPGGFFGGREFSVEAMDKFCEDWLKKTSEEKKNLSGREKKCFGVEDLWVVLEDVEVLVLAEEMKNYNDC